VSAKVAASGRRDGRAAAPEPGPRRPATYDFSHWRDLPFVSCQCITYGRTTLLDEAVESFLRQDYLGRKELVILNDLPSLELRFHHPEVKVINLPCRMRTIGEKRNACVAMCGGEVIFPWDDDDISLPHRISYSLQQMTNHRYFKSDRMWTWGTSGLQPGTRKALAHAMGCWSRALFDEVGGYPHMQSGQDAGIEERFKGKGRIVEETPDHCVYYIYRFADTHSYHLSSHGYGRGYQEAERFVAIRSIGGVHDIRPHWKHDYVARVARPPHPPCS
jgi:glycosyltransferase involved in cell wall biosynthesis